MGNEKFGKKEEISSALGGFNGNRTTVLKADECIN